MKNRILTRKAKNLLQPIVSLMMQRSTRLGLITALLSLAILSMGTTAQITHAQRLEPDPRWITFEKDG